MIDIRIMAHPKRRDLVMALLRRLGRNDDIVTWDDRPRGGDAQYTSRLTWLQPMPPGAMHRLVLQDDADVCDDFTAIVERAARAHPDAIMTFFHTGMRFSDRKVHSPYVLLPGANIHGVAIMMHAGLIGPCHDWIARHLGEAYPHNDRAIGEFALADRVKCITTVPSICQHLCAMDSILDPQDHNGWDKVATTYRRDVAGENWDSRDLTIHRNVRYKVYWGKHHYPHKDYHSPGEPRWRGAQGA